jgi:hypothetical protein
LEIDRSVHTKHGKTGGPPMKKETAPTTSPKESTSVIGRIFTSKLFLIAVCSVLVYTLAGFFLLPYILKSQLKNYVAEDLRRTLQIEKIRLNPYIMTLEISDLALKEADGKGIVAFKRFFIDFELKSLFRWAWTFSQISLEGLVLQVDVAPDKSVNLDRLLQDLSPPASDAALEKPVADSSPPRLYFERIQVANGNIHINDRSLSPPAEIPIEPINLEITDLTTLPEKRGPHRIVARLPYDGILEWSGEISLNPMWSEGQFKLKNIHAKLAWNFLKERLKIEAPEGILGLEGLYRFDYTGESPQIEVSDLNMGLEKLHLKVLDTQNAALAIDAVRLESGRFDLAKMDMAVGQLSLSGGRLSAAVRKDGRLNWENILGTENPEEPRQDSNTAEGSTPPLKIHMKNVALKDMGIQFEDNSRLHPIRMNLDNFGISLQAEARISGQWTEAVISQLGVDVNGLVLHQVGEDEELVTLPHASVRGGQVDVAARRVSVKEVELEGGELAVWRTPNGDINVIRLTASENEGAIRREISKIKETAEEEQHPWSIQLVPFRVMALGRRGSLSVELLSPSQCHNSGHH